MMHATKETWILSAAAAVAAAGLTWGWSRLRDGRQVPLSPRRVADAAVLVDAGSILWTLASRLLFHVLAAILTACLVAAAFFSMFGRNWEGPWKSISAYANYFRRGSQPGEHSEPWYYYLQLLFAYRPSKRVFWSEGFIAVLALIGGACIALAADAAMT